MIIARSRLILAGMDDPTGRSLMLPAKTDLGILGLCPMDCFTSFYLDLLWFQLG